MARGKVFVMAGALMAACLLLWGCSEGETVLVGFSGPLEGNYSDLGVQGRNGAMLAMEEINRQGGVDGRMLELVIRHDGVTGEEARQADEELIRQGVVAIIGHMTSSQSMAALPAAQEKGVLLLSPTTSTPLLSDQDDEFFRLIPTNQAWAEALALFALEREGLDGFLLLGDSDNSGYTDTFFAAFSDTVKRNGGHVVAQLSFSSNEGASWDDALDALEAYQGNAVVVAASARDVADFAKNLRVAAPDTHLLIAPWAYTLDLVTHGGEAVEGVLSAISYSEDNDSEHSLRFKRAYVERFGSEPGFAAAYSYDAMTALALGLERHYASGTPLKEALVELGEVTGAVGEFEFNEYGDVERPTYIVTVRKGRLATLDIMER